MTSGTPVARLTASGDLADLADQVRSSLRWAVAGQVLRRGGSWLSTIVLARLWLNTADFGIAAVGLTVSLVALSINDLGVAAALTRHSDLDARFLGTARTLSAASSIALFGCLFSAAPALVHLAGVATPSTATAIGIVRLFGLTVVIDGLAAPFGGVLGQALGERRRALAENAGIVVSLVVGITVAALGGGPWALAGAQVAASATTAILLWRAAPQRAPFGWDSAIAKRLLRFGLPLVTAGLVGQLVLNTDFIVVSRVAGAGPAGLFFLAFNIAAWPASLLGAALRRTAVAGFARLGDTPELLQPTFLSAASLLLASSLPLALGLAVLAPEVIEVLYGETWRGAATPMRLLAGLSVLRLIFGLCNDVLTALGRTAVLPPLQLVWWVVLLAAMPLAGSRFGLVGVAVAEVSVAAAVAGPLYCWALGRAGISLGGLWPRCVHSVCAGAALFVGATAARCLVEGPLARLVVGAAGGALSYLSVVGAQRWVGGSAESSLATTLRQSRK